VTAGGERSERGEEGRREIRIAPAGFLLKLPKRRREEAKNNI
jgi:hypothetical protein